MINFLSWIGIRISPTNVDATFRLNSLKQDNNLFKVEIKQLAPLSVRNRPIYLQWRHQIDKKELLSEVLKIFREFCLKGGYCGTIW